MRRVLKCDISLFLAYVMNYRCIESLWQETAFLIRTSDTCISDTRQNLPLIVVDIIGNSFLTSDDKKCILFKKCRSALWQILRVKQKLSFYENY